MKATTYSGKLALLLVALHATGLSAQTLTIFGDSLTGMSPNGVVRLIHACAALCYSLRMKYCACDLADSGLRPVGGGFAKWAQQTLRTSEVRTIPDAKGFLPALPDFCHIFYILSEISSAH